MAFDTNTRNRLNKFVAEARRVLTEEFSEQLQSLYGISATGGIAPLEKLTHLDAEGLELAATLPIPFEGQAIDWDPKAKRLLWGISRKDRKAIAVILPNVETNVAR